MSLVSDTDAKIRNISTRLHPLKQQKENCSKNCNKNAGVKGR